MQKIELTKKVIIELFVIAGLFLVLLFFAVSQKVTIGQKYQQVYFNGELVGNIAGHVSVDDAVHEVRRELAAESDEPLCMDYEYSSSKANDWPCWKNIHNPCREVHHSLLQVHGVPHAPHHLRIHDLRHFQQVLH